MPSSEFMHLESSNACKIAASVTIKRVLDCKSAGIHFFKTCAVGISLDNVLLSHI